MKTILHLCADIGSDSAIWADNDYNVIRIGKEIGVENYTHNCPPVYGIIANPPCTEFSNARTGGAREKEEGLFLVNHCLRIIKECNPIFWVIENPASGSLRNYLGDPDFMYQPWEYGSPWTKKTALWGKFIAPDRIYSKWNDVPKNESLYIRPGRKKPSLAFMHKSHIEYIPEFSRFKNVVDSDMSFRSLCSQKFAQAFFDANSFRASE